MGSHAIDVPRSAACRCPFVPASSPWRRSSASSREASFPCCSRRKSPILPRQTASIARAAARAEERKEATASQERRECGDRNRLFLQAGRNRRLIPSRIDTSKAAGSTPLPAAFLRDARALRGGGYDPGRPCRPWGSRARPIGDFAIYQFQSGKNFCRTLFSRRDRLFLGHSRQRPGRGQPPQTRRENRW